MINQKQIQEMQQMLDDLSNIIDNNLNNKSIQQDAQRLLRNMEVILNDSQMVCEVCGKIAQTYDYFSKKVCNDCINAEEHGEKANN